MSGLNPLQEFPTVRQWSYRIVWIATALLTAVQIFFAAMPDLSSPSWMAGAVAVLAFVSGLTNYTADQNVYPARHAARDLEGGDG